MLLPARTPILLVSGISMLSPVRMFVSDAAEAPSAFAGHDEGARSWGRIGSLIETCKMNGVEPCDWLKDTLEKIAARLETEANHIPLDHYLNMHPRHPTARNATRIVKFATLSLLHHPNGPNADTLRRIIQNARQIIDGYQPGHRHPAA